MAITPEQQQLLDYANISGRTPAPDTLTPVPAAPTTDASQWDNVVERPTPDLSQAQPGLPGVNKADLAAGMEANGLKPQVAKPGLPHPIPGSTLPHPIPGTAAVSADKSSSVTQKGFSGDKYAQISKSQGPDVAAAYQAADAKKAEYAPQIAALGEAHASATAAETALSTAEMARTTEAARHQAEVAKVLKDHQDEMASLQVTAQAKADTAKATYQQMLKAIPDVNSGKFYDDLSPTGWLGLGLASFLHGFLGAGGIKTDAMNIIQAKVKNSIDAQIENVRKGEKVAAGFKDIWDMTVQTSATDAEARQKMFGFGLQSMQAKMASELGAYDSAVVGANHQVAAAKLREDQLKNDQTLYKQIDDAAHAELQAGLNHAITRRGLR
jgi:hypothetical protein